MKINQFDTNLSTSILSCSPISDVLTDFYNFLVSLEDVVLCVNCDHCYNKRHSKIEHWFVTHSYTDLFLLFAVLSPIVSVDLEDPLYFLFDYFDHNREHMETLRHLVLHHKF